MPRNEERSVNGPNRCPSCRAILSEVQVRSALDDCPYCGSRLDRTTDPLAGFDDPYAPPKAPIWETSDSTIPVGLGGKLALAFRLFFGQLPLLAAIVLTVWIPLNCLIELVFSQNANAIDPFIVARISGMAELVFGPICAGAILTALANRMHGERTTYTEALKAGLHHWGRLFGARFVAGIFIGLGLLAFIVPGVILALRYSLVDEVVVLEGEGVSGSRTRSTILTEGRRSQIFAGGFLIWIFILVSASVVSFGLELVEISENPWISIAYDCLIDLVSVLLTCLFFVFYWEASEAERQKPRFTWEEPVLGPLPR